MIASNKTLASSRAIENENERKFQVYCRVRPLQQTERSEDIAINDDSPTITIFNHIKNTSKQFSFHRIFGETTKQSDFSQSLADQVYLNCLQNGRGCLVLSYGVTNSGKTYTIMGNNAEPGLLPTLVGKLERQMVGQQISIRAMEIYTDEIYCLRTRQRVQLKEAWAGYDFIGGCQYETINSQNAKEVLGAFVLNRKAAETNANRASSRSHAIFMLQCGQYHIGLADLAGNERFGTHANIQETFSINKNLLVLGKCIHAFRDGERMPYRECKLTLALMEYFKPNYKIYMVAHLNRSGQMFHQNVNVLEYAAVSTQVRHINLKKNHSIAKSIKKTPRQETFQQFSQRKPQLADNQRYQNKLLLDRYRCYIIGKQAQIQENIDEYFKKEDEKDKKFLEDLRANKYVSPRKERQLWLDKLEAQSRIKLRQMFLDEVEAQKKDKLVEYGTIMGTSMKKNCYEYFKPKSVEKIIQKNEDQSEHLNKIREENISVLNEQVHVQENPAFQNSLLMDGIRSQKDASTNGSGIDLLRDSMNQITKPNIEAIPELVENETATKSALLISSKLNKYEKFISKASNIRKQADNANIVKKNETNYKSTQQTMSRSFTHSKSPLQQKSPTPNKHRNHNCGAHPLPAKEVQKMSKHMKNIKQSMKVALSTLKTRNQRRKQQRQQENINVSRNLPRQKKRKNLITQ